MKSTCSQRPHVIDTALAVISASPRATTGTLSLVMTVSGVTRAVGGRGSEQRAGELVEQIDLEALEIAGTRITERQRRRVLVDAGLERAPLHDRAHDRIVGRPGARREAVGPVARG